MPNSEFTCTPPEVSKIAADVVDNLLPTKSSGIYEAAFKRFQKWCNEKNIKNNSENVLLAYFSELANKQKMKGSTMWSHYSMLRSMLNIKQGIDISKYLKLRAYLKKLNEGCIPKKAKVFTREQFEKFLSEAPNQQYLGIKVNLDITKEYLTRIFFDITLNYTRFFMKCLLFLDCFGYRYFWCMPM